MEDITLTVYNDLKESTAAIAGKCAQYADLEAQAKSGKYSAEEVRKNINPKSAALKREISDDSARAINKATALVREYQDAMRKADALNPEDVTKDAELLRAGVKLRPKDIEAMLERNQGNATMEQLILRYVDEHGVDMGPRKPVFYGHSQEIQYGEELVNTISIYGRWINTPTAGKMLDRFFNIK